MIVGVGLDVVDLAHFKKVMGRGRITLVKKMFTEPEQKAALKLRADRRMAFYAKRYAAKEAFVKALGTGFNPLGLKDVWVENGKLGEPILMLSDTAKNYLKKKYKRPMHLHLSLTDDGVAAAIVVLERM